MENKTHTIKVYQKYAPDTCKFKLSNFFKWRAINVFNSMEIHIESLYLWSEHTNISHCCVRGTFKISNSLSKLNPKSLQWLNGQIKNNLKRIITNIIRNKYPELSNVIMVYPLTYKVGKDVGRCIPSHQHSDTKKEVIHFRFIYDIETNLLLAMFDTYHRWAIHAI